ncbi:MAG: helix-turn-helix domain-containing protein [Pseudonocardiaceae bacterium]
MAVCNVSSRHLCRLFAAGVGITPSQYVRLARLEAAGHLLTSTGDPVATVARRGGFGCAESLRQALVRHTARPPPTGSDRLQGSNLA